MPNNSLVLSTGAKSGNLTQNQTSPELGDNSIEPNQDTHRVNIAGQAPELTNAELVQLQIRVISLENLLIALLANSSPLERHRAREMAAFISPRRGFTQHRLTLHAAAHMIHLVDRSEKPFLRRRKNRGNVSSSLNRVPST